ncbi:acyltransferase [Mucilaginibacter pallidiroseus]|uniref:Acyltransferase n=1 Tax=Mucilaginibacter pallidiroseus TaxID=2599295 RepID=A0A563UDM1_9SPHI|nr:acyltransferase family protein [Mucilaginibacter pallidiroseus]TWR29430.1 acyltransferase [Mucilaginibacter pallidiroseus]
MPYNKNAFDALRILLCLFVFVSHGYLLAGIDDTEPLKVFSKGQVNLGNIGVAAFFALSGFLITASFTRTANPLRFLYNRVLRILPGFWACLLVTAFILAPAMHYLNNATFANFNFLQPGGSLSFVKNNALLSIGQWGVSDATAKSYYQASINGSLWSL